MPSTPLFDVIEQLADGSQLVCVYPDPWARRRGDTSKAIKARLITYTIDEPYGMTVRQTRHQPEKRSK